MLKIIDEESREVSTKELVETLMLLLKRNGIVKKNLVEEMSFSYSRFNKFSTGRERPYIEEICEMCNSQNVSFLRLYQMAIERRYNIEV